MSARRQAPPRFTTGVPGGESPVPPRFLRLQGIGVEVESMHGYAMIVMAMVNRPRPVSLARLVVMPREGFPQRSCESLTASRPALLSRKALFYIPCNFGIPPCVSPPHFSPKLFLSLIGSRATHFGPITLRGQGTRASL